MPYGSFIVKIKSPNSQYVANAAASTTLSRSIDLVSSDQKPVSA